MQTVLVILVWTGFGRRGKWQPKSKDLLNTKFVLRWIAIITATSVARIAKPKITSETLFEIMISQHKLEYQDYQSGGVGHLLGRIPFPSHFPINILNCFFTFPAFFLLSQMHRLYILSHFKLSSIHMHTSLASVCNYWMISQLIFPHGFFFVARRLVPGTSW